MKMIGKKLLEKHSMKSTIEIDVPCNGCTLCCQRDLLFPGHLMLAHKPNGDCIYLDREHGCTIHDCRPRMCREMDCRNIASAMTWTQARKAAQRGIFRMEIWKRGKELLKNAN